MPPRPKWSRNLARPVRLKDGTVLTTLREAADFVTAQDVNGTHGKGWNHAAGLLMEAAKTGDVAEVTKHIEMILWHEGRWVMPV